MGVEERGFIVDVGDCATIISLHYVTIYGTHQWIWVDSMI